MTLMFWGCSCWCPADTAWLATAFPDGRLCLRATQGPERMALCQQYWVFYINVFLPIATARLASHQIPLRFIYHLTKEWQKYTQSVLSSLSSSVWQFRTILGSRPDTICCMLGLECSILWWHANTIIIWHWWLWKPDMTTCWCSHVTLALCLSGAEREKFLKQSPHLSMSKQLSAGELAGIERETSARSRQDPFKQADGKQLSRRHIEAKLSAALTLGSADEYREWLLTYCRQLTGFSSSSPFDPSSQQCPSYSDCRDKSKHKNLNIALSYCSAL